MIELPHWATRASFSCTLDDKGFNQEGLTTADYIPRKGSKYIARFSYGPFNDPDQASIIDARITQAKLSGGMRVKLPLLRPQGSPGAPLVDGAVLTGRTLPLKGLTPGYLVKEGYWLSIEVGGRSFLHKAASTARASDVGELDVVLSEMLRINLAGDEAVNLASPAVEGLIEGDSVTLSYDVNRAPVFEFAIVEKQ